MHAEGADRGESRSQPACAARLKTGSARLQAAHRKRPAPPSEQRGFRLYAEEVIRELVGLTDRPLLPGPR